MNNNLQEAKWSENVILVDADYVDRVAFNLIVNFERMLGRRIVWHSTEDSARASIRRRWC